MARNLLILIILFFSFTSIAQKKIEPNQEDIQIADNLKINYPDDKIVLLSSYDYISFGFNKKENKVTVNHKKDEALINLESRASIQKYCFYDGESKIKKFKIKYKNNKRVLFFSIKDEAYISKDLFHIDTRVQYAHLDFPLKGYRYSTFIEKEYFDVKYFTKIYFNDDYPIQKKVIQIEIPTWLDLELKELNFEAYTIEKEEKHNEENDTTIYTYTVENLPARADEKNSPGSTHIYPHLLILPKYYTYEGHKNVIFNSTQDLYNWYKSLVQDLKNDNTSFASKVKELVNDAKTDEERIKNIYYWVQDNIRYIAFEDGIAGFKPDEASNVFTKKYGDCKGMANLTKQMLIEAGFDARLTWIGTNHIAYDYSTPNLSVDNHMICTIFMNGKPIFLDGTEKFNAYGEYANRIQGKQALIENGEEFKLETVPKINSDFNKEVFNYNLKLNGEILEGVGTKIFIGESRASLLYNFDTLKNDKKNDFLEFYLNKGDSNIKVENILTSDLSNREIALDISYNLIIKNMVSSFDNDVYVNIDFDRELENFKLEKRTTDYVFSFKRNLESSTTLEIPSNYSISQLPNDISIKNPDFELSVNFIKKNNTIIYTKKFSVKNTKIATSDFEEWNNFIFKLKSLYNEQIILTQK